MELQFYPPGFAPFVDNISDTIVIHIFDAPLRGGGHALEVTEDDLTNHTSGFMIASAANGFMNTNPVDCSGTPFSFQPEYSSAAPGNIDPWGFGDYNIDSEFEIGHFEPYTKDTPTGPTGRRRASPAGSRERSHRPRRPRSAMAIHGSSSSPTCPRPSSRPAAIRPPAPTA